MSPSNQVQCTWYTGPKPSPYPFFFLSFFVHICEGFSHPLSFHLLSTLHLPTIKPNWLTFNSHHIGIKTQLLTSMFLTSQVNLVHYYYYLLHFIFFLTFNCCCLGVFWTKLETVPKDTWMKWSTHHHQLLSIGTIPLCVVHLICHI